MKNTILAIVFVAVSVLGAKAQSSANVKVNVVLNPTLSISLGEGANDGSAFDEVTLEYKSAEDYTKGVDTLVADQLKVTSIGSGYRVRAELSNGGKFAKKDGSGIDNMDASQLLEIGVGSAANKKTGAAAMDFDNVGGSNASSSVLNKDVDVYYRAKELNEGQIKQLLGDNATKSSTATYTVDVVYTIAAN